MHGDHLPKLRKQDRPEISDEARHFDTMSDTVMMKHVNIMYKEHQHVMQKLVKGQDVVYKMMCRVQQEKRKIQRAECARRQEEIREKMKSERVRTLMKRAVAKFRENVQRKKKERALAEKRKQEEKKAKRDRKLARKGSVAESGGNVAPVATKSDPRGHVKVQEKEQETAQETVQETVRDTEQESMKTQNIRENPSAERRGSLTREEEPSKYQNVNDTIIDDDLDQVMGPVRKSRVLEVSKTPSAPVTRTKGDEDDEDNLREPLVTTTYPDRQDNETGGTEDKTEENDSHSPKGAAADCDEMEESDRIDNYLSTETDNSDRRPSLFGEENHDPDLGWFTYGNPHVPLPSNYINISDDVLQEIVPDYLGSDTDKASLPPLRIRRAPLAPPPSSYLKEQLRLSESKEHATTDSGVVSFQGDSTDWNLNLREMVATMSRESNISSIKSIDSCSSPREAASTERGPSKQSDRSNISRATSSDKKAHPSTKFDVDADEPVPDSFSFEVPLGIIPDTRALLPVKQRRKKPHANADKNLSANMMWVLKQEEKSRRQWQKRMTEDDKVIQYYKTADGRYIATVMDRRKEFLAPSFKEYHRQQKLLVGERVKSDDHRERMTDLMDYMALHYGMANLPVAAPTPSPEPKKRQQPVEPLPSFSYGSVFDEYRQRDLMVDAEPGSYEAMKGVAYLRINDEKYKPVNSTSRRRERKVTTWNQQY
ncbi:uncharacterized protein LOC124139834 isoform X2 [Haliotis rufescens]|nr:uncharacterized protein LOC124139834 isoform X2 [Haliotis rufescens]